RALTVPLEAFVMCVFY
ncbi:DUF1196 domain-containing protein, partial [Vibrio cholerae]